MSVRPVTIASVVGGAPAKACGPAAVCWFDPLYDRAAQARRRPGRSAPQLWPGQFFGQMQGAGSGGVWPRTPSGPPHASLRRSCWERSGVLCGEKWPHLLTALRSPRAANLLSLKGLLRKTGFRARVLYGQIPPHNNLRRPCWGPSGVLYGGRWLPLFGAFRPPHGAKLFSHKDLGDEVGFQARLLCGQISPHNTLGPSGAHRPKCYTAKWHCITSEVREPFKAPSHFLSTTSRLWATPESRLLCSAKSPHNNLLTTFTLAGDLRC